MHITELPPIALSLFMPLVILDLTQFFFALTILRLLVTLDLRTLLSWKSLQEAAFSRFWLAYGPVISKGDNAYIAPIIAQATGTVVDIGPGTGLTVKYFDREKVTKIYGIEPNKGMHEMLRENIKKAGLEGIYEIVGRGAEDVEALGKKGITLGSVDSVVTVKVLCSIPNPKVVLERLYVILKPGGQWLLYEHVTNRANGVVGLYQSILQLVWPHCLAGCNITRHTDALLLTCGQWSNVSVGPLRGQSSWETIPFVQGRLVKEGKNEIVDTEQSLTVPETRGIVGWWREQDMSVVLFVYLSISYTFWGLVEGLR